MPPSASFCPRCGVPLSKPAARSNRWWIAVVAVVALIGIAWLLLAGMPFGSRDRAPEPAKIETIAEAEAPPERETPAPSATIVDVEAPEPQPPAAAPPSASPPSASPPPASRPAASPEISGGQAEAVLRGFVTSRNYYRVTTECVGIQNRGYENVGYTLEVWDRCAGGGASRLLGRWRVDARTREIFRQREDGRYLRP